MSDHTHRAEDGFVPRFGADLSSARYELLTAAQAVERVAAVGFDRTDAQLMVEQYLAQSTAALGTPPGDGWRVDPYDLAEIARAYEWVDHYRGETLADARARAAEYAADYHRKAVTMDREQDPGYAARVDREAVEWADRARDGHNPWPAPDPRPATAEGTFDEPADVRERAAVEATSDALLDDDEAFSAEQAARAARVSAASWALAARDMSIERGESEHAARFAHHARQAITALEAMGVTRDQLAAELDYPGGAAELDGEHVDLAVAYGTPLTAATLAGWDAADNDPEVAAEHAVAWTQRAERMAEAGKHTAALLSQAEADRWTARAQHTAGPAAAAEQQTDRPQPGWDDPQAGWPVARSAAVYLVQAREKLEQLQAAGATGSAVFEAQSTVRRRESEARYVLDTDSRIYPNFIGDPARAGAETALAQLLDDDPDTRAAGRHALQTLTPARVDTDTTGNGDAEDRGDGDDDGEGGARRGNDDGPAPLPVPDAAAGQADRDVVPDEFPSDTYGARDTGQVVATFDPADAYTDAEIASLADAHARGDHDEVTRLEAGRLSLTPNRPTHHTDRADGGETARGAGGAGADRMPERDDPAAVAWWAPTGPGAVALTRGEAEAELTERGFSPDEARAAVTDYLDQVSHELGTPVHRWGMDSHDVEAIAHTHPGGPVVEVPEQRRPAARSEWDQVRGEDPRGYTQMMSDAAAAFTGRPAVSTDADDDRRDQLIRWHTEDQTPGDGDGRGDGHDAPVRALDDFAPAGATTSGDR